MNNVELFWNEEHTKYAVLVSGGFGTGWSSWGGEELAYDKRIVAFWLKHKDDEEWMQTVNHITYGYNDPQSEANKEAVAFFKSIGYDECPCLRGFNSIHLEWISAGEEWTIEEYEGSESLRFKKDYNWVSFS